METLNFELVGYYIYAYCDLNKPGIYKYNTSVGVFEFEFEPIYIGKGTNNRIHTHQFNAKNDSLNNLINCGKYTFLKIKENLPSHTAYMIESELIYQIGRLELNKGPLFNESAGVNLIESKKYTDIGPLHLEFNKMIHVLKILNTTDSLKEASKILGISERTLYRYNNRYSIKRLSKGSWVQLN